MAFLIVKWIHILSAIIAVGANITYSVWLRRAEDDPVVLPFTLRSIKHIDARMANPAYVVLLLSGLVMVWLIKLPLTTPWLLTSLILYAGVAVTGIFVYSPILRRQIELAEQEGAGSPAYREVAGRSFLLGMLLIVIVAAIVFLMVAKPALWA